MKFDNSLENAVETLTRGIYERRSSDEEQLSFVMVEWGFLLPMATAILTVLNPEEFTIYDTRVCESLGDFEKLANKTKFETIWDGYQNFRNAVRNHAPSHLSLRDQDRYLWGQSFYNQLNHDIESWNWKEHSLVPFLEE